VCVWGGGGGEGRGRGEDKCMWRLSRPGRLYESLLGMSYKGLTGLRLKAGGGAPLLLPSVGGPRE